MANKVFPTGENLVYSTNLKLIGDDGTKLGDVPGSMFVIQGTLGNSAIRNIGTTANTVAAGNDSRFTDSRTPVPHQHVASDIISGTFTVDRLGTGVANTSTYLRGDGTWNTVTGGSSGGSSSPVGDPVVLSDAATVTPDASLLTSSGSIFTWTLGGNRTLNKPTGVPAGKAQRVRIRLIQDATGSRILTLGPNILPSTITIDPTANAITDITLETIDGGNNWQITGGGVSLGNAQYLGTDQTGTIKALSLRRALPMGGASAPASGDIYPPIPAAFASVIKGVRGSAVGTGTPTVTGTIKVNGVAVAGLTGIVYGAQAGNVPLTAATGAPTFVAGDVITFEHTAAPGGTVTR